MDEVLNDVVANRDATHAIDKDSARSGNLRAEGRVDPFELKSIDRYSVRPAAQVEDRRCWRILTSTGASESGIVDRRGDNRLAAASAIIGIDTRAGAQQGQGLVNGDVVTVSAGQNVYRPRCCDRGYARTYGGKGVVAKNQTAHGRVARGGAGYHGVAEFDNARRPA